MESVCEKTVALSGPDDRPPSTDDDDTLVDWDDFEAMTDRVLAIPPRDDEDATAN